jgi:hypothetical protein
VRTNHLRLVTPEHSDTMTSRSNASSPYGPVRAGLTTWPDQETLRESQLRQLTELLNSLESVVANLNYKSSTVLDTLLTATQGVRAALKTTPIDEVGTDVNRC